MKAILLVIAFIFCGSYFYLKPAFRKPDAVVMRSAAPDASRILLNKLRSKSGELRVYAQARHYSTRIFFLADMSLPAGKNRLFVYDAVKDSILAKGLVAHGSCNAPFQQDAFFSNEPGCGCSAKGKYKIGYPYQGRFGKAYKLYGLDSANSNAFRRNIVFHSYECVPDDEVFPEPICNSLGCAMVSPAFLQKTSRYIEASEKPILLFIFK